MSKQLTDYMLYRWRFILGYGLVGAFIIAMIIIAGLYIPGGISSAETSAVITSSNLNLSLDSLKPESIINLPYHLLQRSSFELFGISQLSIKLPSIILSIFSALGIFLLLRMWFKRNVAVLATVLVVTTSQFLLVSQSGTPGIVYIFWSIWLLVCAMMVSRQARFSVAWKIALFAVAALSLYTPLSIYILAALLSASVLHPHLRYIIRRLPRGKVVMASACGILLIAPLIYAIVLDTSIGLRLLGVPKEWPDISANISLLISQYFNFHSTSNNQVLTPIYGLGSMILIFLGIARLLTTKYTARSYIISAWIILLSPVLVINPDYISVTFVPALLLMAMGISNLTNAWYKLFPLNPYARIAGLIPLVILLGGMMLSGVTRFTYGYLYDPSVAQYFSKDLQLISAETKDDTTTTLITSSDELPFYQAVASHKKNLFVTTSHSVAAQTIIATRAANVQPTNTRIPERIVTTSLKNDADRLYIYKTRVD